MVEVPRIPADLAQGHAQTAEDTVAARLVELRHFGGPSIEDAAAALGLSRATAYRQWTNARAWLSDAIAQSD